MSSQPSVAIGAEPSVAAIDDPRVAEAMQEYLDALEAGRSPSREEFLAQHPDIAPQLAGCLDGLDLVHEAARAIQRVGGGEELGSEDLKAPLGDFRIVREIGRGGMGVVYEAVQLSLGRHVALKVLPFAAALDPKQLQRFKNEAQAAAQLHHTNIVPVYAVGSERGVHYYSMQLIDGYSLADLIEHRRRILGKSNDSTTDRADPPTEKATPAGIVRAGDPATAYTPPAPSGPREGETKIQGSTFKTASERNTAAYLRTAANLIRQAALALAHAHQQGVIHRDIKPANLLLDERGHLWVTDFGLAQFQANMQLTRTGDLLGTMRYMSPEQASGDRVVVDHRTDIYSLGVTLYELLTLEPAVSASDARGLVLWQISEEEPRTPRSLDKHIPVELETIVLKAIAKTPGERYATGEALADDLQRWLDDKPIQARRPTLAERAARWGRRNWSLVMAVAGVLLVATLGLALSTILISQEKAESQAAYYRERKQRDMADGQRQAADEQRTLADAQRALADKQRAAADESFRQARRAVDTFLELSEEELAAKPSMEQTRRRFLLAGLEYYNEFLEQRRNDPAVAEELAKTTTRVTRIVEELSAFERLAAFMLLSIPEVQQDIGLFTAQREVLEEFIPFSKAAEGPGSVILENSEATFAEQVRDLESKVSGTLTGRQLARLQQIALQQRGPFAFKSMEVSKALNLTVEQRRQINTIIEEESPMRRGGHAPGFFDDHGPRGGRGPGGPGPGGPGGPGFGGPGFDGSGYDGSGFGGPGGHEGPKGKKVGPRDGKKGGPGPEFEGPGRGKGFGKAPPPEGRRGKMDDHGPPLRPEPDGPFGERPHGPPDFGAAMKRTVERIEAILNEEQLAKWREMVGPRFDHPLPWRPE